MKKLATLMLVVMMAFSITACGSTEETKRNLQIQRNTKNVF